MEIIRFLAEKRIYYHIFLFITLIIIFNIFLFLFFESENYSLLPNKDNIWDRLMFNISCLLLPFLLIIFYSKHIFKFKIILLPVFSLLTIMIIVPFFEVNVLQPTDTKGLISAILLSILVPTYLVFVFLYLGLESYIKRYTKLYGKN